MGWPLRAGAKHREFGGSFIYPMGDDLVSLGLVVGLDYRDAALSVHDLLQQLKTHPFVRGLLEGGERVAWGAKTIPEGGFVSLPRAFHAPGLLLCGDGVGLVNVPALKGIHYAVESGRLAADAAASGELASYDESLRSSFVWDELRAVRNMRQAFGAGFWRGSMSAGLATVTRGLLPPGDRPTERDTDQELFESDRAASYPAADGKLTFDKLSSVFLSGNRTRDDVPDHIRVQTDVPRIVGEMWARMCPAQVYEIEPGDGERVHVTVTPSNCVQCGAISAKGGRLTPSDGGAGPEYTLT
jgi:electron-transferring-flavoprotein dehydrogenase